MFDAGRGQRSTDAATERVALVGDGLVLDAAGPCLSPADAVAPCTRRSSSKTIVAIIIKRQKAAAASRLVCSTGLLVEACRSLYSGVVFT